jgi:hypothetical protein
VEKYTSDLYYNHITMLNDASRVISATIWSITLESSITILEALFIHIYDVYSTGITYNMFIIQTTVCFQDCSVSYFEYQGLFRVHKVSQFNPFNHRLAP